MHVARKPRYNAFSAVFGLKPVTPVGPFSDAFGVSRPLTIKAR